MCHRCTPSLVVSSSPSLMGSAEPSALYQTIMASHPVPARRTTKFEFDLPLKSSAATAPPTEEEYEFDLRATSTDNSSAARPLTPSFFSRDWVARHSDTALRSLGKIARVGFEIYAPSVATASPTKEFELRTLGASNGHIEGGQHIDPSGFGLLWGHATQRHRSESSGKRLTKKLWHPFLGMFFNSNTFPRYRYTPH